MAIQKFDPDPDKAGWGTVTDERGRVSYDYFPNFYPQKGAVKQQVAEESGNIANASVPAGAPGGRPDARLAQLSPDTTNAPVLDATGSSQAPDQDIQPPTDASTEMKDAVDKSNKARGLINSGRTVSKNRSSSTTAGRSKTGAVQQITAEGDATNLAREENLRLAKEQDAANLAGYDAQLRNAESDKTYKEGEVKRYDEDIRQNSERIHDTMKELDPVVDPGRYFRNMSTGQAATNALLAGIFGGLGNIGTRPQENLFLKAFTDAADQDLKVQEDEVKAGRSSRNNRIAQYQSLGADLKQAKMLAQRDVYDAGRKWLEINTAKETTKDSEVRKAQQLNSALTLEQARREASIMADTESRTSYNENESEGINFSDPTTRDARAEIANRELDDADSISTMVGRKLSPAQVKEIRANSEVIGKDDIKLTEYAQALNEYATALGVTMDPDTLEIVPGSFPKDAKGVGIIDATSEAINPWDDAEVAKAKGRLIDVITATTTGAAATIAQDKRFEKYAGSGRLTQAGVEESLKQIGNLIRAQREAIRRRDPDAAIYYDTRNNINGYTQKKKAGDKKDAPAADGNPQGE